MNQIINSSAVFQYNFEVLYSSISIPASQNFIYLIVLVTQYFTDSHYSDFWHVTNQMVLWAGCWVRAQSGDYWTRQDAESEPQRIFQLVDFISNLSATSTVNNPEKNTVFKSRMSLRLKKNKQKKNNNKKTKTKQVLTSSGCSLMIWVCGDSYKSHVKIMCKCDPYVGHHRAFYTPGWQIHWWSSHRNYESLQQTSWQPIQQLLRYFWLDRSGGLGLTVISVPRATSQGRLNMTDWAIKRLKKKCSREL